MDSRYQTHYIDVVKRVRLFWLARQRYVVSTSVDIIDLTRLVSICVLRVVLCFCLMFVPFVHLCLSVSIFLFNVGFQPETNALIGLLID